VALKVKEKNRKMISITIITAILFLIVLSVIDFLTYNKKKGYIPSVLTTLFLIVMLILGGTTGLYFGVLGALIGWMFADFEGFGGIADWKILSACAMAFSSLINCLTFFVFVAVLSFITKYIFNSFVVKKKEKAKDFRYPFIPVILLSYCLTMLMMVVLNW